MQYYTKNDLVKNDRLDSVLKNGILLGDEPVGNAAAREAYVKMTERAETWHDHADHHFLTDWYDVKSLLLVALFAAFGACLAWTALKAALNWRRSRGAADASAAKRPAPSKTTTRTPAAASAQRRQIVVPATAMAGSGGTGKKPR